nr:hypothetical protein [Tanacetum cinerariifolium]
QTSDKAGLGYNSKVFTQAMFDCDNYYSFESDNDSWSPSNLYDRFVLSGGYHAFPPPMTGTFMPPKPDLVFHTPLSDENEHLAFNVTKDVPSLAQSPELVKTPRHSGLISPLPMSVALPVPLRLHLPSKGLKRPKKTCFVCKSETHLIKDYDFHARKFAQKSYASRDIHKNHAQMHHSRILLHKITTAARPICAARPTFSKTHPHIAPYAVSKSKAPIRRPFIRHTIPKPSISPPRVHAANPSIVSAARVNAARLSVVSAARINVVKPSAVTAVQHNHTKKGNPQQALKDKGVIDSGCSRHMIGNISYLSNFEELNGGYVAFGGNPKGSKISGKGKIKTGKLDFDDVNYVKELKFNLFSVSQMCDKKNNVLFTDTECLVLSSDFKLPDASQVLLRVPRENNMYNVNLKNIIPSGDLTCLFAKATVDESNLWHRRLGHVNFKTINKLVKGNLVEDYLLKFLQMILPVLLVRRANNTKPLVFFLATKDETASVLKTFIVGIDNLLSLKVKIIRCDNGTEFKNADLNQFCGLKGIKREFSIPRTPQQNGITERKNRTLIEVARTLLADSLLPIPFWAEAVNTACYVQNRVLVTKPHNKTPYELLHGRTPNIGFMRPFGCLVTILNTLDPLGKFHEKVDEGFLIGYPVCSKAFRVFNSRTHIVQETLHVNFMENKPNVAGSGPVWLFDIDSLSQTMNYHPVLAENQSNPTTSFQDTEKAREEGTQSYVLFPVLSDGSTNPKNNKNAHTGRNEHNDDIQKSVSPDIYSLSCGDQAREQECINNSGNGVSAARPLVSAAELNSQTSLMILVLLVLQMLLCQTWKIFLIMQMIPGVWQEELEIKVEYHRCSMKTFIPACLPVSCHKRSLKESIKLSKIQVRLKPCKKSSFSSRCR